MRSVEYIVRGIIEQDGKLLLCRGRGKENWFFPGGHVEYGESAEAALLREISEELGASASVIRFVGASENTFEIQGERVAEINLVFEVALDVSHSGESKEPHLEFAWFEREELKDLVVFPASLKEAICVRTQEVKEPLWTSEGF